MGLVSEYIDLVGPHKNKEEDGLIKEYINLTNKKYTWDDFHQSDSKRLIVQAERQSGKTYNILKHIIDSQEEYILWITPQAYSFYDVASQLGESVMQIERRTDRYMIRALGKTIYFFSGTNRSLDSLRGMRVENIYIEDAERMSNDTFMYMRERVYQCVGVNGSIYYVGGRPPVDSAYSDLLKADSLYDKIEIAPENNRYRMHNIE